MESTQTRPADSGTEGLLQLGRADLAGVGPVAGLMMLAIALRGGAPYSLDRRLGKEL